MKKLIVMLMLAMVMVGCGCSNSYNILGVCIGDSKDDVDEKLEQHGMHVEYKGKSIIGIGEVFTAFGTQWDRVSYRIRDEKVASIMVSKDLLDTDKSELEGIKQELEQICGGISHKLFNDEDDIVIFGDAKNNKGYIGSIMVDDRNISVNIANPENWNF